MGQSSKVKEAEAHWNDLEFYSLCSRCDGDGIVIREGKEHVCPSCDGEGVLYREA